MVVCHLDFYKKTGPFVLEICDQELNKNYTELFQDKALGYISVFDKKPYKTWLDSGQTFLYTKFLRMDRGLIDHDANHGLSKGPATPTSRSDRDSTRLWTNSQWKSAVRTCVYLSKLTV